MTLRDNYFKFALIVSIAALLILASCSDEGSPFDTEERDGRGKLVSSEIIASYGTADIQIFLALLGVEPDERIIWGVDVVSIVYMTVDARGDLVRASGAIIVPEGGSGDRLLCYNHGTVAKKSNVSSVEPLANPEGIIGLVAGSMGYIALMPDYLGLGVSIGLHPYLHAKSNSDAIVDFMRAAAEYNGEIDYMQDKLFLAGYSEGGYVTMALHKEIEESYSDEFEITAVVPMAGPYDLEGTLENTLRLDDYPRNAYLVYVMLAYNEVYGWGKLDNMLRPPYDKTVPVLFDGTKSYGEIDDELPDNYMEIFDEQFIRGLRSGTETEVLDAFRENTLLDWTPAAPVYLIHGSSDETVPTFNSVNAYDSFLGRGADVRIKTIPGLGHVGAAVPALIEMLDWIESY